LDDFIGIFAVEVVFDGVAAFFARDEVLWFDLDYVGNFDLEGELDMLALKMARVAELSMLTRTNMAVDDASCST
jgi:hypothetical protein